MANFYILLIVSTILTILSAIFLTRHTLIIEKYYYNGKVKGNFNDTSIYLILFLICFIPDVVFIYNLSEINIIPAIGLFLLFFIISFIILNKHL